MRGVVTTVSLVVSCALAGSVRAGDLNPPAGPVAPSMKTLEAIEPRVCVQELPGAPNATHVISEDGAYYLVGDIAGEAGKHGILITADRVSLHLGPFSIEGVPGSLDGVHMAPGSGLSVVSIRGDGSAATRIGGFGGDGVRIDGALSVSVEGVTLSQNGGDGMDAAFFIPSGGRYESYIAMHEVATVANGGHGAIVASVGIEAKVFGAGMRTCANGGDGLHLDGVGEAHLREIEAIDNTGDGVQATVLREANEGFFDISDSSSLFNGGHGVLAAAGTAGDGTETFNKYFSRGVTACGNGLDGFRSEGMVASEWIDCESAQNGGVGYFRMHGPGDAHFGAITFSESAGVGNAQGGAVVQLGGSGHQQVRVRDSNFARNGNAESGGHGMLIEPAPGVVAAPGASLIIEVDRSLYPDAWDDGLRIRAANAMSSTVSIRDTRASGNGGSGVDVGPADPGVPAQLAVKFDDVFCSANGLDGMVIEGASGGAISKCLATNNGARGIALGSEGTPSFGVRIDECFATANAVGIEVSGEHMLLRSAGSHNALANLSVGPTVFAGPSVTTSATETKPYAWP
ncbi:MAG: hypothetical protein ACF8QF_03870 [Phycisphaerales bacterium]